jgi:hypothetical protein
MISNKDKAIEAIEDVFSLVNLLLNELDISNDLLGQNLLQAEKTEDLSRIEALIRMRIRLAVSFFEAACYAFRQAAYQICNFFNRPVPSDYKELDDRGKKVELKDKIKGSLRFIAHATGANLSFDTSSLRWQKVCAVLDKRHHLTHPHKIEDLKVSNKDLENVNEALLWFVQYMYNLMKRPYPQHLEKPSDDDIKAAMERLRKRYG